MTKQRKVINSIRFDDGDVLKLSKKARAYVDEIQHRDVELMTRIHNLEAENEALKQELMNLSSPNEQIKKLQAINEFLLEQLRKK